MQSVRVIGTAALVCGFVSAQLRLEDYALILEDPPLSRRVSSRASLRTGAALDHGARIAAAQERLSSELERRGIRVTGAAQMLVNAVFVRAPHNRAAELQSITGVKRVQYLPPVHRKLDRAVELVNAPAAWSVLGGD